MTRPRRNVVLILSDQLRANGYWEVAERAYAMHGTDEYWDNFQANTNPIPAEAFIDSWVGDRAVDFIRDQPEDEPFFLFVGLPNPHMPFDCPEPYASMYAPAQTPPDRPCAGDCDRRWAPSQSDLGRRPLGARIERSPVAAASDRTPVPARPWPPPPGEPILVGRPRVHRRRGPLCRSPGAEAPEHH